MDVNDDRLVMLESKVLNQFALCLRAGEEFSSIFILGLTLWSLRPENAERILGVIAHRAQLYILLEKSKERTTNPKGLLKAMNDQGVILAQIRKLRSEVRW